MVLPIAWAVRGALEPPRPPKGTAEVVPWTGAGRPGFAVAPRVFDPFLGDVDRGGASWRVTARSARRVELQLVYGNGYHSGRLEAEFAVGRGGFRTVRAEALEPWGATGWTRIPRLEATLWADRIEPGAPFALRLVAPAASELDAPDLEVFVRGDFVAPRATRYSSP